MATIFSRLKTWLGLGDKSQNSAPGRDSRPGGMRNRIDAAATDDSNRRHWAQSDSYSADAAYDPGTRFRLRNRARYETVNNCYAKASVRSAGDDLIGTGPRLQVQIPGDDAGEGARRVERSYGLWSDETQLAMNLRTAEKSRVRDGEAFAIFTTNLRQNHPVKLFLRWVEAEMCTTPFNLGNDPRMIDGVRFDENGLPTEYFFLTSHPGGLQLTGMEPLDYYSVPAKNVLHWYCRDRFGQHRAIPELTPALPLYSQVRRYTLAALTAAEFAAMLAGVMKTTAAPDGSDAVKVDQWEMFEMVRGALLTLPEGWEAQQFRSENPPTGYGEFKRELLNESGRSTNQPLNVVTGNSSGYNYSSGRLDHLPYQRGLRIQRNDLRLTVLDRIFRAWHAEAVLSGEILSGLPPLAEWSWSWNWDGFDSIDQNKDAMADDARIKNGTSTYAEILSEYGQDWMQVFEQMAREKTYADKLGLPWPVLSGQGAPMEPAPGKADKALGRGQPADAEQAVRAAMEEAGVAGPMAERVMEALAPEFSRLRSSGFRFSTNGHHG